MKPSIILIFILFTTNVFSQDIEITSPKANNEYNLGDRIPITWKDISGITPGQVKIQYSVNNSEWRTINENAETGPVRGWFDWQTEPGWKSGNYKIKIKALYGNMNEFITNGSFQMNKKGFKDTEVPETNYMIILSQGFIKRTQTYLYQFKAAFEPVWYWFDNTLGAGVNVGTVYKNPGWSGQIGPVLNIRLARDFLKFENIILGKVYWTTSFLFQNSKTKMMETGFLLDAGIILELKYGREFWKNEWCIISGAGIDLALIF